MSGSRSDDISSVPNRDKGKAPQKSNLQLDLGDFSPSKRLRTHDQTERNSPRPNPRISYVLLGPKEGEFASRTLAPDEADPTSPVLRISNDYEHFVFLDIPSFIDIADMEYSVRYRVFGEEKREYEMVFSRISIHGSTAVVHYSDWERIVRDHSLRAGDEVSFDRYLDTNISNDFFYILKYTRKRLDGGNNDNEARNEVEDNQTVSEPSNVNVYNMSAGTASGFNVRYHRLILKKIPDQEEGNLHGPGSRYLPPEAYCLTKTLNVVTSMASLCLTLTDAVILTENPKIAVLRPDDKYSKDFVVFDGENRQYRLTLNHNSKVWRNFQFYLGGEWIKFVTRHNLKVGDRVMIYKILDASISLGYYHVLRYVSMKPTDFGPIMNDSIRAWGIPLAAVSDQRRNILLGPASHQRSNIPLMASGDQRRNIQLADAMDQRRNIQLATADYQRRNIQLAAALHHSRNIPLAVAGDQRRNILLGAAASDRRTNVPEGPSSRSSTPLDYCITKTLDPRDVSETDSRLHLDALSEAIHLCKVPSPAPYPLGTDPKTLLVYDKDMKPYEMLLSHYACGDGVVTYTLGGDWQNFVRAHGLRADDKITIYRVSDSRVRHEYYFVLKGNRV